ncbi:peptidyl-prolyl cis-trans isomerase (rotamase) [Corynebacterium renale]|uniref:peptidylprolyl isomerase n=1 Tax=Corynebacterium renale TaxID=1724 RepID=UPI000DA3252C|nr:peptidylprolyl isomerase [Corynebacterium renale]SQG64789.1 peptidyl-prolyl cis-trans isomerase (rotamase) [Corynebacterium renale]
MTNTQRGDEALEKLDKALKSRERKKKSGPAAVVAASLVVIVGVVAGIWYFATQDSNEDVVAEDSTSETTTAEYTPLSMKREEQLPETVSCTYEPAGEAAKGATPPAKTENVSARGTVNVELDTTQGKIGMELDRETAPCTVNAIEHLVENNYYDDTVCHRLTTSGIYVLQCGDPTGTGAGGPGFQFANEYPTDEKTDSATGPVIYPRGSIAMANAGPGTNGSQFFLNYKDSPLAPDYTYFGQISDEGLKTLDSIAEKGTESTGSGDGAPAEEVRIKSATIK